MAFSLTQDLRTITELKRNTKKIIDQAHKTGRPIIITVNGKPDTVLMDAKVFEKNLQARNFSLLIEAAEEDIQSGRVRPMREFLKDFRNAKILM